MWWWWSRRPRVKYSALPLAGGVDETMLRTRTKRSALQTFFYLAVFVLIIISVSFARFAVRKLDFSPIPSIRPPNPLNCDDHLRAAPARRDITRLPFYAPKRLHSDSPLDPTSPVN